MGKKRCDLSLRLGFPANKHDEVEDDHDENDDEYFMKKIQELFAEKRRMFADWKSKETKRKQTTGKRSRSTLTEEDHDDGTTKKKIRKKKPVIVRTPVVSNHVTKEKDDDGTTKKKMVIVRTPVVSNYVTDDGTRKKKIRKKKTAIVRTRVPVVVISNQVTEELKEFITREMNGTEMKVVIQKSLYRADLKKDQNRLSMPMNQVQTHDFLTADERRDLEKSGEMAVRLLGPRLRMYKDSMMLKIWHLKNSNNYVLKTKWNDFVKENQENLKEGKKIQVWSFRKDQKLCFAIACIERPPQNDATAA